MPKIKVIRKGQAELPRAVAKKDAASWDNVGKFLPKNFESILKKIRHSE